ncbi:PKD domain-containing protein [Dactylosporangium vinaceum]|uniref:PKD domain-containing protein n=1 Tax=Dactylosporangium vinaceum TaxID=53362 RepID=A0ABV5M2J1_9ACTN|nr:PKD domain-containing protein [Dactylosporangium vinaceum]UAB96267.1 PKD domain-containing protein [Dactylosporangium vinaceum]
MLTLRRSLAALGLAVALTASFTPPAQAGGIDPVDCSKTPNDPKCKVEVEDPADPGGPGGPGKGNGPRVCHNPLTGTEIPCSVPGYGDLADDGCYYRPAVGQELRAAEALGGPVTPPDRWYIGSCGYPPSATLTRFRIFAGGVVPDPAVLAARAVRELNLPLPAIRVNPSPPAKQLAYLPTWLWLDASSWGAKSATASVPGLSVTATAKPAKLVFSTGEGASVTCAGRGTEWTRGTDPEKPSPTCGHTYTRPGSYSLTATVTWQISWAGGGQTGTVPDLVTTSTVALEVTESQALNTNP